MLSISPKLQRFRPQNRHRRKLPFPATPNQRIAQISSTAKPFDLAQPFPRDRWHDLENFEPQVLVGSASDLLRLHRRTAEPNALKLCAVDHAIFVLTQCGHHPLSDVMRVTLWQAFGVPLFELFIGSRGRLLATECEAHEGWHVEPGNHFSLVQGKLMLDAPLRKGIQTGLTAEFDNSLCACGREGLRLVNIDGHAAWAVRKELAATA